MKNLLTGTALIATLIAGNVSAATVHWQGDTGNNNFTGGCQFTENTNGSYKYTESTKTWAVDDAADISILVRQDPDNFLIVSYIEIVPVKYDGTPGGSVWGPGGVDEWAADIDYEAGSVPSKLDGVLQNWIFTSGNTNGITAEKIQIIDKEANNPAKGTSGVLGFDIGGTAKMTLGTNELIDADTKYKTSHMITCFQDGTSTSLPGSATGGSSIPASNYTGSEGSTGAGGG
jgi:hypothetical protein